MIRVTDLEKVYGHKRALGPVSFTVERGETLGILGRNGAGKTTLLRILAGDLRPSAGFISIDGVDALRSPEKARVRVGYLPEVPPVYEDMRVGDFLVFAGRLRGMERAALANRLREVERLVQLEQVHDELIRHLSHGYRQRVGLAQAIIHDPPLLILDEPTHDLDPVQIVEMRGLIRDLKGRHTVLISSHILPEIHEVCDRLLVVDSGRVVAAGAESVLTGRFLGSRRVYVTVRPQADAGDDSVTACMRAVEGVAEVATTGSDDGAYAFDVSMRSECRAELCRALVLAGHDVLRLERAQRELESVFIELVGGGGNARD
ncbi:MAG: ABC transporter ATP-binding protein [Longimicrobiales bacterium]